jgi:isopenicillin N synthase-like dioxygenase
VIDLAELQSEEGLKRLKLACEEWGAFQLVNHGIAHEVLDDMEATAREFFMLPVEEKEKYRMDPKIIHGYGHAFIFSEDQKLDWCNMLALAHRPAYSRRPEHWPGTPDKFKDTMETYFVEVGELCQQLLAQIAVTLGLSPVAFDHLFGEDRSQSIRMNFYPSCPTPDLVLGLSSHSDGSAISVLQQDMSSAGLQVLKNQAWVPVEPVSHGLVIILGDTLEVLSNGRYKSVEHRAVTNHHKERLSMVSFYAPSYDADLGPMPELLTHQEPARFRRYNHMEYITHYITTKLNGRKSVEFAKVL